MEHNNAILENDNAIFIVLDSNGYSEEKNG